MNTSIQKTLVIKNPSKELVGFVNMLRDRKIEQLKKMRDGKHPSIALC